MVPSLRSRLNHSLTHTHTLSLSYTRLKASSRGKSETASVLKELLRAQASATHTIPPSSFTSAPSVLRADPAERELSVGHKDNHSDGEADDSFGSRKSEKQKRFLRARSSDSIRSQAVGSTFATPPRNFTKPTIRLPSPPPPGLTLTGSPRAASTSTSSSSSKSSKPRRPRSSTLEAPLGDRATQIMPDTSLNPLPAPVPTLSSSTGSTSRSHRKSSSSKPSKKRIRRVSAASEFSTTSDTTTGYDEPRARGHLLFLPHTDSHLVPSPSEEATQWKARSTRRATGAKPRATKKSYVNTLSILLSCEAFLPVSTHRR